MVVFGFQTVVLMRQTVRTTTQNLVDRKVLALQSMASKATKKLPHRNSLNFNCREQDVLIWAIFRTCLDQKFGFLKHGSPHVQSSNARAYNEYDISP